MPKCWDAEKDWAAWNEFNKRAGPVGGRKGKFANYCADCSPKYQFAMQAQNRCGHPETHFVRIAGTEQFNGRRK